MRSPPRARQAGLTGVDLPTCAVAGEKVNTAGEARCFADYMRIHALEASGGLTYSQLPRYATEDGKGTNDPAQAQKDAKGQPVSNAAADAPASSSWPWAVHSGRSFSIEEPATAEIGPTVAQDEPLGP
jgi:hypothetical protein